MQLTILKLFIGEEQFALSYAQGRKRIAFVSQFHNGWKSLLCGVQFLVFFSLTQFAFAQLRCLDCEGRDTTRYTNGMANDSLYFICVGESAALEASVPDSQELFDFQWYRYIAASNNWQPIAFTSQTASASYSAGIGGFRIVATNNAGVSVLDEVCWISRINFPPIVNASTLPPGCGQVNLESVYFPPNITAYRNPPSSDPNLTYIIDASTGLELCLNIEHPILTDLAIELIAPAACGGATVLLSQEQTPLSQDTICYNSNAVDLCFSNTASDVYYLCVLPEFEVSGNFGAYGQQSTVIDWSPLFGCAANQAGWQLRISDCEAGAIGQVTHAQLRFSGTGSDQLPLALLFETSANNPLVIADDVCNTGSQATTIPLFSQPIPTAIITPSFTPQWTADPPIEGVNGGSFSSLSLNPGPTQDTYFTIRLIGPDIGAGCDASLIDVEFFDYIQPDSTIITFSDDILCLTDSPMLLTSSISEGQWQGPVQEVDGGALLNPAALGVGEWLVTYLPNSACIDSSAVTIFVDQAPVIQISSATAYCSSEGPVALLAMPQNGSWSGEGIADSEGLFDPSLVNDATAQLIYTTSGNCPASDTVDVVIEPFVFAEIIASDLVMCASDPTVNFDANLSPGIWSGPGVTGSAQGLFSPAAAGVGQHWIRFEYTGLCSSADSVIITLEDPSIDFVPVNPLCVDAAPVDLGVQAAEGFWSGPGVIDSVLGIVSPELLGAGVYHIRYQLNNSCTDADSLQLIIEDFPDVQMLIPQGICIDQPDLPLTANYEGGMFSGNGVYSIGSGYFFNPSLEEPGMIHLQYDYSGVCTVTIFDSLEIYPLPLLEVSSDTSICPEGEAILRVLGADQYSWEPQVYLDAPSAAQTTAQPNLTTTFTVVGQSQQGCSSQGSVLVEVLQSPIVETNSPVEICTGEPGLLEVLGGDIAQAVWSGPALDQTQGNVVMVTPDSSASYTVIVTDAAGCTAEATADVIIYEPLASFIASDTLGVSPMQVFYTNTSAGDYFVWDFGNGDSLIAQDASTPASSIYSGEQIFNVTLTAYLNGCSQSFTDQVMTYYDSEFLIIPNIVTPNGDGKNDTWLVVTQNMKELHATVFNRWGRKVGSLERPNDQWNPEDEDEGTFYYEIVAIGLDQVSYNFDGYFTVLKGEK